MEILYLYIIFTIIFQALVFLCAVAAAAAVAVPVFPAAKVAYAPASISYAAPLAKVAYAPAPVAKVAYASPVAKVAYAEPEAPANYEFNYSVHDTQSGDIKQQHEQRAGEALQGSYSLIQPDGVHRIVDYTADEVHGFNAVVRYEGQATEAPTKIAYAAPVAKLAYAAPVAKVAYAPAPVSYAAAPVAKVAYAPAPVTYAAAPVAKVAYAPAPVAYAAPSKLAYSTNLGHVSFSSPAVSYQH
ncbi:cuticle protein 21 [Papilio machaon]|uniref:cuticle protein 21 n=1 Tax=Papilio machaon TaxID=76193 RepID=UPI001E6660D7|nr:cuticle protein 21 [Papilio machaon]